MLTLHCGHSPLLFKCEPQIIRCLPLAGETGSAFDELGLDGSEMFGEFNLVGTFSLHLTNCRVRAIQLGMGCVEEFLQCLSSFRRTGNPAIKFCACS